MPDADAVIDAAVAEDVAPPPAPTSDPKPAKPPKTPKPGMATSSQPILGVTPNVDGRNFFPASSILVERGTSGFYSGARDAETLMEYNFRMGDNADTVGDIGWLLGTKPRE